MTRSLALDVGDRRMGVALSDEAGLIARPLAVIRRASKREDFALIAQMIRAHDAHTLVVGHPLDAEDRPGPQAGRVERYAAALAEALRTEGIDLQVVLWDEYGSTQRAQEALIAAGRGTKNRRALIDSAAAAVILQDYLDSARRTMQACQAGRGTEEGH